MTGYCLAVVVVREGLLPAGAVDAAAESGGRVLLVGSDVNTAAGNFTTASDVWCVEVSDYGPAKVAAGLAPIVCAERLLILPSSPDGRDLAPRIAATLGRSLFTNAVRATAQNVVCLRRGDRATERTELTGPAVITIVPGSLDWPVERAGQRRRRTLEVAFAEVGDAQVLGIIPPDPAAAVSSEASRTVGDGEGVSRAEGGAKAAKLAHLTGASVGGH